jgi:hypothetical protein
MLVSKIKIGDKFHVALRPELGTYAVTYGPFQGSCAEWSNGYGVILRAPSGAEFPVSLRRLNESGHYAPGAPKKPIIVGAPVRRTDLVWEDSTWEVLAVNEIEGQAWIRSSPGRGGILHRLDFLEVV